MDTFLILTIKMFPCVKLCKKRKEKQQSTTKLSKKRKKKQNILLFAIAIAIIVPFNWMQNIIFVSILSSKRQYIYVYYIVELYKSFLYQKRLCFTKPTSEWENIPELPVHRSRRVGPVPSLLSGSPIVMIVFGWNVDETWIQLHQKLGRKKLPR